MRFFRRRLLKSFGVGTFDGSDFGTISRLFAPTNQIKTAETRNTRSHPFASHKLSPRRDLPSDRTRLATGEGEREL